MKQDSIKLFMKTVRDYPEIYCVVLEFILNFVLLLFEITPKTK